ncbi:fibronectin type III domain-containing protein [Emticicia sp. C21]|uniref:fibronectin type III domain-containing protein n=1 Tax=Emticicia sp. C21 TaxID=2302915 RepID=UPI000E354D31|nr:fibronectin type III domain-containing protein [Emticicia sp. C21]RFS16403.1 fibronectin type III domain-containing protein [Emticicia sp. C21]
MRLYSNLNPAVIIALLLSCLTAYSQTPFISQLESLNEGKETKITIADGVIGQDYTIQYRLKNTSSWTDSQVKIKRNTDVTGGTVTGLEINKNYCFRVIQRDSVTKAEILSNEVCSIYFKSTLLSDKAVKLEWSKIDTTGMPIVRIAQMDEDGRTINSVPIWPITDTVFVYLLI